MKLMVYSPPYYMYRVRTFLTCSGDISQYQVQVTQVAPRADVVLQHLLHVIFGKNLVQRPAVVSLLCHLLDHRCEVFERQRSHHHQI